MSRYSSRVPFSTAAPYTVVRAFLFNGVDRNPGDAFPLPDEEIGARRCKMLYDQRKITMAAGGMAEAPAEKPVAAPVTPTATTPAPATPDPAAADAEAAAQAERERIAAKEQAAADAEAKVAADAAAKAGAQPVTATATMKHIGFGKYQLLNAAGQKIGEPHANKADAQKALDAL